MKRQQSKHKDNYVWSYLRREGAFFSKVKKLSKILLLFLLLISSGQMIRAQQDNVTYRYDAAGNRISRTIIIPSRAASFDEEKPVVYSEIFSDIQLKIYPNPTNGLLKVEIYNLPEDQMAQIWIYAMSGQLIASFKDVSSTVNINISNQPAGMYLMKIVAGKFQTEWKIIKK
jgi:hypothetical protein